MGITALYLIYMNKLDYFTMLIKNTLSSNCLYSYKIDLGLHHLSLLYFYLPVSTLDASPSLSNTILSLPCTNVVIKVYTWFIKQCSPFKNVKDIKSKPDSKA
jgi:hypothetical protein